MHVHGVKLIHRMLQNRSSSNIYNMKQTLFWYWSSAYQIMTYLFLLPMTVVTCFVVIFIFRAHDLLSTNKSHCPSSVIYPWSGHFIRAANPIPSLKLKLPEFWREHLPAISKIKMILLFDCSYFLLILTYFILLVSIRFKKQEIRTTITSQR